jgi:TonB family protein
MHRPGVPVPSLATVLIALLAGVALFASSFAPALAQGKPDLKTYPSSDFTDTAYMQKVHEKVGRAWKRPAEPPRQGSKSVVIATWLRDGSLMEAKLHHRSGSEAWDASALAAVRSAAPIEPLPKSYPRTSLEVHFHFEYN